MTLGVAPRQADLFRSTAAYCEGRVAPDSIYGILHRECFRLFPDEMFADLFDDAGRRSVPPMIVAVVMVLQRIEGCSDRRSCSARASPPSGAQRSWTVPPQSSGRQSVSPCAAAARRPGRSLAAPRRQVRVGVAELGSPSTRLKLRVDPKIEADLFLLADWAYGRVRGVADVDSLPAHIDVLRREPAACLLGWYLDALEAFVIRWLRRDFQLRSDVLVGRVRGRILMPEYVTRHVAAGRPHHVPCQYLEASRDTLPNRILRRALHEIARVIPTVGCPRSPSATACDGWADRASFCPGVHQSAGRSRRLLQAHPALPAAPNATTSRFSARAKRCSPGCASRSSLVSTRSGRSCGTTSILFQEALRGIFSSWDGATLDTARGRATLIDADGQRRYSSKVDPDYVLRGPHGTFVLDAKWKNVLVAQELAASDDDAAAEIPVAGTRIKIRPLRRLPSRLILASREVPTVRDGARVPRRPWCGRAAASAAACDRVRSVCVGPVS